MFINGILRDMRFLTLTSNIYEDNTGDIFLARNKQVNARTKHIDFRHHFLRDFQDEGTIKVLYLKVENNVSDILTKNTMESIFSGHANKLLNGNIDWSN